MATLELDPLKLDPTLPKTRSEPEPLAEGYYLENFKTLLDTVGGRYSDLLSDEERAYAIRFDGLSQDAQRLYVRLISRKGPYFRRDRLSYSEIGDLDAAIVELQREGFMDDAATASTEDLLDLLLRGELQEILRTERPDLVCGSWRKHEVVMALLNEVEEASLRGLLEQGWTFLQPLHQEILTVYRLLFFGNLSQDLTTFVLHDLGVVRYEAYELRRELRRFPNRQALDDALTLRVYRQLAWECLEREELDTMVALGREVLEREEPWEPTTTRLRDRLCNQIARALERQGDLEQALAFYTEAESPPARERRARILERLERPGEALDLCVAISENPRDETERLFAPRFQHQLRRKLGQKSEPWRRTRRPVRELCVEQHEGWSVEWTALQAFAAKGRTGFFAENWLWKSLFGLAFWDIIFAPIAGAFEHPFQFGPLDLHSAEFHQNRHAAINERLAEIRAGEWTAERLLDLYQRKQDTANAFVSWQNGQALAPHIELALAHLSADQLAWVCERMSRDPGRYRRGLPDLFVPREEGEEPGFDLFEVKGPGDQLRPEQKSWIDYLNAGGLSATVLKVRFEGG